MTETLRRMRPRCRSTGVWPRGAQLRRRGGAIKNPASSMKTIAAPRRLAFFYLRPRFVYPALDRGLIAFYRMACWWLWTPA